VIEIKVLHSSMAFASIVMQHGTPARGISPHASGNRQIRASSFVPINLLGTKYRSLRTRMVLLFPTLTISSR
jgi:hypothetical protein